jgi:gamma-glutamylcyclotransferase (GGCT)/AIG2-like uncharacterized protein YtfP
MTVRTLFVYGTLRPASRHPMAHRLRASAKPLGTGTARGTLYDFGYYPGATFGPGERGRVVGEVFAVPAASRLNSELDYYEGAPPNGDGELYRLVEIEVVLDSGPTLRAVTYALLCPPVWARPVPGGDWIAHTRARARRLR